MEETFRKLYVVTGNAKSKVGNTPIEQGCAALCDAETPAVAYGFHGVSHLVSLAHKKFPKSRVRFER